MKRKYERPYTELIHVEHETCMLALSARVDETGSQGDARAKEGVSFPEGQPDPWGEIGGGSSNVWDE